MQVDLADYIGEVRLFAASFFLDPKGVNVHVEHFKAFRLCHFLGAEQHLATAFGNGFVRFYTPITRVFIPQKAKTNHKQPFQRVGAFFQDCNHRMVRWVLANFILYRDTFLVEGFERQRHHSQLLPGGLEHVWQRHFRRYVSFDDYRRVHRDEIHLCHVHMQPYLRLIDHTAAIRLDQLHAAFKLLHLTFLVGHQHVLLQRGDNLHSRDALPRRNASRFLDWQRGDASHLQCASQAVVGPHH